MKNDNKKSKYKIKIRGSENQITFGSENKVTSEKTDSHFQDTKNDKPSSQEPSNNNEDNGEKTGDTKHNVNGKEPSGWAKLLFAFAAPIIVAIIAKIPIDETKAGKIEQPAPTPEAIVQLFLNKEQSIEYSQFEYVECILESNPILPGYQVKPYPYIAILNSEEWIYIPVIGLYTQEQYSADNNGICKLKREDITTQLQDISAEVSKKNGQDYKVGCLLIIEYVANDGSTTQETYELRIGQLSIPAEDEVIKVLSAYTDDTQNKINVTTWPSNKEQIIKTISDL